MQLLADSGVLWILLFIAIPVLYMLPTIVGAVRRVDGLALVCLVNLIGAPTGVGWLAAMILAFGPRKVPLRPSVYWLFQPEGWPRPWCTHAACRLVLWCWVGDGAGDPLQQGADRRGRRGGA